MILFFKCLPRLFRQANKDMRRHFSLTFSSILSISIALLISMLMIVVATNVSNFTQNIEEQLVVQVSINPTLDGDAVDELSGDIKELDGVQKVTFSDKDEELDKLIEEYGSLFSQYKDSNPLYDVFVVELESPEQIDAITKKIDKMDGVMEATYGTGTVNTMVQIFSNLRSVGLIFLVALTLIAVFLIRNTIKLAIQVRKNEIRIMRQVGAYNWYITVPFVLEGISMGFFGALGPCLICGFGYYFLYDALGGVFMSEMFTLVEVFPFVFYVCAFLMGIGMIIGMIGSFLASRKYLRWSR